MQRDWNMLKGVSLQGMIWGVSTACSLSRHLCIPDNPFPSKATPPPPSPPLVHQYIPPVCLMPPKTAQIGRQAKSGLLARDAWGELGGQAVQAVGVQETPQPPRSCYLRCTQHLARLHLFTMRTWVQLVA